jgi:pantoate--beta-alanine ligase
MVQCAESIVQVRQSVANARASGLRIGLVPTMGALHAGHERLIEECRDRADFVVVSIFVNPTQFGPTEDFSRYPRTLESDLRCCERAGAHVAFLPTEQEIYPHGRSATFVEVPGLSHKLEGASRPGHFRGVATVVLGLFQIVQPDLAVFGQKDYQQQLLIRTMVRDLHVPVEVVTIPTIREADGLAMSSRNRYLDADERRAAAVLHRALQEARTAVAEGERDVNRVRQILDRAISLEVLAALDYAEVVDAGTLERVNVIEPGCPVVALLAVRVGTTRLIDNMILTE